MSTHSLFPSLAPANEVQTPLQVFRTRPSLTPLVALKHQRLLQLQVRTPDKKNPPTSLLTTSPLWHPSIFPSPFSPPLPSPSTSSQPPSNFPHVSSSPPPDKNHNPSPHKTYSLFHPEHICQLALGTCGGESESVYGCENGIWVNVRRC